MQDIFRIEHQQLRFTPLRLVVVCCLKKADNAQMLMPSPVENIGVLDILERESGMDNL